jgi:hypothetical protein
MIQRISRDNIDIQKYDACIENSIQSRIFAYSWYLDIVADNWEVLVLGDYEAVMPLPWKRKYFIKYVYPPFWLLELGIYSVSSDVNTDIFIKKLDKEFRFVELRMNTQNKDSSRLMHHHEKQMQSISLQDSYETISSRYSRNRKRDLKKSEQFNLTINWDSKPEKMIALFKENVGKRVENIKIKEYNILSKLLKVCIEKGVGEMVSVLDDENKLVASAFFLKHKDTVTELVCSTDFKNRNNGANTYFNDYAIQKYQANFSVFCFGGSSMTNIANYYKSFGAKTETYYLLKKRLL